MKQAKHIYTLRYSPTSTPGLFYREFSIHGSHLTVIVFFDELAGSYQTTAKKSVQMFVFFFTKGAMSAKMKASQSVRHTAQNTPSPYPPRTLPKSTNWAPPSRPSQMKSNCAAQASLVQSTVLLPNAIFQRELGLDLTKAPKWGQKWWLLERMPLTCGRYDRDPGWSGGRKVVRKKVGESQFTSGEMFSNFQAAREKKFCCSQLE